MLQFFDSSLDASTNPVQTYTNGGITGLPMSITQDTKNLIDSLGWAVSITSEDSSQPTDTDTGNGGGFDIFGLNGFAVLAFLAGLILIFKWK